MTGGNEITIIFILSCYASGRFLQERLCKSEDLLGNVVLSFLKEQRRVTCEDIQHEWEN